MVKQKIIKSSVKSSYEFHIGVSEGYGEFVLYEAGTLDRVGNKVRPNVQQEINYVEVLMAVKNALLYFRDGTVEFENEDGTESWKLTLEPTNDKAKELFQEFAR